MLSVLYVDDEPCLLEVARLFLEHSGEFRVTTSTSAQKALDTPEILSYNAIISDYQMPGMDGIAFLKAVRQRSTDIPFILFTGRGREEVVIEAINNGADFYLQKGGDPKAQFAELAHKIRQAVARRQAERSLLDSERRLSDIINFLPDATFAIDKTGTVIAWNRAMEEMTGMGASEVLGVGNYIYGRAFYGEELPLLIDLVLAPDERFEKERYSYTHRDGTTLTAEMIRKKPDGTPVYLWGKASRLYDKNGNLTGAIESIRDITERRKDEEELHSAYERLTATEEELRSQYEVLAVTEQRVRESEQRFRSLIQNSSDMIRILDRNGLIAYSSPSTLRMFGYDPADLIGKDPLDYVHPDDRKLMKDAIREVFSRTSPGIPTEYRIRHHDGHYVDVESIASNQLDTPGIEGVVATTRPITERRRAKEALRKSEEKFRRLADNAPDMIYRMALPEGRYDYISPACVALTGYTPEEFYKDPDLVRKLIHPAWQDYFCEQWEALLEKKVPPVYEYQIIDRAGKTRWLNQRNLLITGESGQPVAIEGIVTDMTQQKNTERELQRREQRSLAVSGNAGFWIWETDPDGVYRYSSPAIGQILGYRPDELVGKVHFYELFDPSTREELKSVALAAFGRHEQFRDFINLNRHKDGTPVLLRTSGTPVFEEDGTFSGYYGIDEDVTERMAAQSAMQAMVGSMVGSTGLNSLQKITENVSSWLGVDCVMVGEIQPDGQTVRVLAMRLDGKNVDDYSYTLKGTPCEDVAEKGFCLYPDDAIALFPESKDLVELKIRGYIGTPLRNSQGVVSGILCALSKSPIRSSRSVQEIMGIIAVKAAAEIERIQTERELLKNRQQLEDAMKLANLVNWEYDLGSGMFAFDDRFYALCGTTADREGGSRMSAETYAREFVHPDDRHAVSDEMEKAARSSDPDYVSRREHRIIRRDGEVRHVLTLIRVMRSAQGLAIKAHGTIQDFTDRKRAEEALRESENRFRTLFENANDAFAVHGFTPEGIPTRFTDLNENT
jgi:PAS domain S-box-containing protein